MSELRRIGGFKDSGLSGGRVVLSDAEGDIRLVYRDGALYLHDKEPVGDYVARELVPRLDGLEGFVERNHKALGSLRLSHERDMEALREVLSRLEGGAGGAGGLRGLELSMPLDKIVDGRFYRYLGREGVYEAGEELQGFAGVTYAMTLGDVLRSSLLCLDVVEEDAGFGGVSSLEAQLVSRDGVERRYLSLSRYKPAIVWKRYSPKGVDMEGVGDGEWERQWRDAVNVRYKPNKLYGGTEIGCSIRKYDALLVYVSAKLHGGIDI